MAVKEVHGPGPRGARGPRPKVENPGKLLRRIMDEVFRNYLPHCILVLICIVVSALANVQASLFLQTLMDDYIVPMTHQQNPSFAPLAGALLRVGCIYLVGILAAWINARVMVNVTQGTLRNLRTKLFTHMESLPISYFDTHPHGDIMSVYTNDVDTLRQMISQSIPQLVSSVITIVSVFFSMCMLSWQLTIVTMLMVALMLFCSKKIAASSGKYFVQQQRDLGKVNGYIEEMMEGQKVVKVFTHEQQTQQLALAIRDEVLDLEAAGIKVIQIDEAALREKLPLRKTDWHAKYLDWAIPAFRLVHSAVKPTTQIHTHMCYSEFNDIITDIDAMDADVISFEASRGDLVVLDAIHDANFETEAGPGVYDIHSPRIPSEAEIEERIYEILKKMDVEKVWINPDCGLKTRGNAET